ncbi:MAG: heat-inducible transcriptional repressor HrcA [Candidatus Limnocylindria bacterium]
MTEHRRPSFEVSLSERQRQVLRAVVEDYLLTAVPVGSLSLVSRYRLDVSPATVRSEMAGLESLGLLMHPHTSAGRIPSDLGYRVFVESLMREAELDGADQTMIRHQFSQVQLRTNDWLRLAASILAGSTRSAAVVTPARARRARFGHVQIAELADQSRLLVLVLGDGNVVQRKIDRASMDVTLPGTAIGQLELDTIAALLNRELAGMTAAQIRRRMARLPPPAAHVARIVEQLVSDAGEPVIEEVFTDGLVHVLEQPEFAEGDKLRRVVEVLQRSDFLEQLLPVVTRGGGVHVIIGRENENDAMHEVSLVFAPYGTPDRALGLLGVLGPTRMPYPRAIPTVRYLSAIMNELIGTEATTSHD